MWGLLYLALLGVGLWTTYVGVLVHRTKESDDRMRILPSAVAALAWVVLALTPSVQVADGAGGTLSIALGAERWLFGVLALLTTLWLAGVVIGVFPEDDVEVREASTYHDS